MAKRKLVTVPKSIEFARAHEGMRNRHLARLMAEVLGYDFAGEYNPEARNGDELYFVPDKPIEGLESAVELGIQSEQDLYGGVVPQPFVKSKAIVHPLVHPNAYHPLGWSSEFARSVSTVTLPGYTAFTAQDTLAGGHQLLGEFHVVRMKRASAAGSSGQFVVRTAAELRDAVSRLDEKDINDSGVVLECDLVDIQTLSVGQVSMGPFRAAYFGTQRDTVNNEKQVVYGGSDLTIVRGGFSRLLEMALPDEARLAIQQARTFDEARRSFYPQAIISRNNYDIGQGNDSEGVWRSGVLEQSWRVGGASGPEIVAIRTMAQEPRVNLVRASSFDRFGENLEIPREAVVHFHGVDKQSGPMAIYTVIHSKE